MTDDLEHLIADALSGKRSPADADVKKLIKEHLNPGGCTDQEEDT